MWYSFYRETIFHSAIYLSSRLRKIINSYLLLLQTYSIANDKYISVFFFCFLWLFFIRFRRHSPANQVIHSSTHPSISSASYSAIHFRRKWSGWEKRLQPASARYAIPLPELEYVVRPHEKGMISSFIDAEMRSRLSLGFVFACEWLCIPF